MVVDLKPLVIPTSVTPSEALEYFRSKGFAPPEARFSHRDWWGASHARGFVVAKAMQDDILRTMRDAVERAIAEGQTLEEFRAGLEPELRRQGWWGRKTITDPLTGETREVQLGSARRLRVIFDTNMRTAYAAGRWMRIQRTRDAFPYLQYIQLQRVSARDEHKPFHDLVIPVDHPFWATHFPPNGWFCACTVRQLSEAAVKRRGLTVTTNPPVETRTWEDPRTGRRAQVPTGITPGFDTNPGAAFLSDQGRHDQIAVDLTPEARGVELGLINEARRRGLRTGNEHLAALDLGAGEAQSAGGPDGVVPVAWVEQSERKRVEFSASLKAALADAERQIGVVHNHPDSWPLSRADMRSLEANPGMIRAVAVGHDGSLYRASNPRAGLGYYADRLWQLAWARLREEASTLDMDEASLRKLAGHASASALDRADLVDYSHAIAGGSRVNLMRFGEDRMEAFIEGLVRWLDS